MKNIFIGFLLIFLDFNLNLGGSTLEVLPDFIGYIFMVNGLAEMVGESTQFIKVKPYASGMAVFTGILYLLDLFGISALLGVFVYILAIVAIAVSLYISYCIVIGVQEMELNRHTFLDGGNLKSAWNYLAVYSASTLLAMLIPSFAIIIVIFGYIVVICFLVAFNKSKNLYDEMFRTL